MKKSLKNALIAMLVMIFCLGTCSMAATGNSDGEVVLTPTKSGVNSGDEFTVIVSQVCDDGIIGFESSLSYDSNVFEFTGANTAQDWTSLGEGTKLEAMTDSDKTSGDVFTLNFKVKDSVGEATSEIKLSETKFYKTAEEIIDVADSKVSLKVNENQESEKEPEPEPQPITLSKIEVTKAPTKTNYTVGEKFNTAGLVITATYSDNTTKEVTNYTYSPNGELKTENKLITFSYEENGVTKSTTQSINVTAANNNNNTQNTTNTTNTANTTKNTTNTNKTNTANKTNVVSSANTDSTTTNTTLPKTGSQTAYIMLIVAGLTGVAIVSYIGYKKYKEI